MGAQLDQILGYLDRPGVTEVAFGVGRSISIRREDKLVPLTAALLTRAQVLSLINNTPLEKLMPEGEGTGPSTELQIGARRIRVQAGRRGDELLVRIEKILPVDAPTPAAPAPAPARLAPAPPAPPPVAMSLELDIDIDPPDLADLAPELELPDLAPRLAAPAPRLAEPAPRPKRSTRAGRESVSPVSFKAKPMPTQMARPELDLELELPQSTPTPLPLRKAEPALPPARQKSLLDLAPSVEPRRPAPLAVLGPPDLSIDIDLDTVPPRARAPSVAPSLDPALPRARRASVAPRAKTPTKAPRAGRLSRAPALGLAGPPSFAALVRAAHDLGASDLHIAATRVISIRVLGELIPLDASPPLSAEDADMLLLPLLSDEQQERLAASGYVDLAIEAPGGGRLRANLSRTQGGLKGTFRIARRAPATLDELGLSKELAKVIAHHQGLVVIAGPSGHGKTTTLTALVDLINSTKAFHIITVEDPVEIVYPRKAALVSQREVGPHTRSFAAALKGSLREDPDVIVIGELRDRETVEIALTASETGHLVLATMSTPNAAKTIDRLVDMFPPEDQSQVRASIAGALRAVVSQRLLPAANGQGVVPAIELLTGVLPLAAMIRDDKLYQLPNLMQRGRSFGMIRFDDSLQELVRAGKITVETALATTENKRELAQTLKPGGAQPAAPDPAKKGGFGGLFGGGKKGIE